MVYKLQNYDDSANNIYILVSSPFFLHISCNLDELLNIDNSYFEGMVTKIYASELQLKKLILLIPMPYF